uniref:Putative 39s ribosomal protein l30 mitochondrial n=1 Tax=Amblyomma parvum TaxID=251391 RepID=A0A023G2L1_AMBPA
MISVSLLRPVLLSASRAWPVARCTSSSSSGGSGKSQAQPTPINGYERTAQKIFEEVRETRRKAATGDWEVPKLFLVERVGDYRGTPHWERNVLKLLKLADSKEDKKAGIHRPLGSRTIVKNTPFMCKMLWRVKHLVKVSPITFPDGEPTEVMTGTHLSRDGVFRIVPHLKVPEQRLLEPATYTKRKFTRQEISRVLHENWNHGLGSI